MGEIDFENMNDDVKEYALKETERTEKYLKSDYDKILNILKPYVHQKKVKLVKVTKNIECFVTIEDGMNKVIVNNYLIYSTTGIIVWVKPEKNGNRIALFETNGSDYGILKIFKGKEMIYTEKSVINDILFTQNGFYIIKEKRDELVNEDMHSGNAVYLNGNYVFGNEIKSGEGIEGEIYGDKVILVSGDNISSSIYTGLADNPSSWKLYRKFECQVKILGYRHGTLYTLLYKGFGIISDGKNEFSMEDPVEDATIVKEGFLVIHMRDAKAIPVIYDFDGRKIKEFDLGEPYGLISMDSDGEKATVIMGSFGVPYAIFSYSNMELKLLEQNIVSKPKISEEYVENSFGRVHYFFLEPDKKTQNTIVYGYGGFNISIVPAYYNLFAYLLNNGVNVVICNLPGGGEYGEEWHRLGMKENKKNVYSAFQSIIKKLSAQGKNIICYGVSNGGLLAAYTMDKIPEYLAGAIIGNPVIDLMRFHRLLAGQYWVSEYGNPDNQEDVKFLRNYSAYEQLKPGKYPPSLIYSRMNDDRVHPAHALKFYKKLRDFGNESYILIGTGGHLGSGIEDMLSETAYIASFINTVFKEST